MKKLLSLLLVVLLLAMPLSGLAETGIIGGADGATAIFTTADTLTLSDLGLMKNVTFNFTKAWKAALDAGRRAQTTITLSDWPSGITGEAQVDQIINDVLNALKIDFYQQGDEGVFALNLSGNDVLTMGGAMLGDDIYLNSNLLGGTIVFTLDEIEPIVSRLLDMFVVAEMIPAEDAEEIKAQLPQIMEMVKAELEAASANPLEGIDLENLNLNALVEAFAPLANNVTVGEVTMQPRNCDPATSMATLTVTPDEFKAMVKAVMQFLKDNPSIMDVLMEQSGMNSAMVTMGEEAEKIDMAAELDEAIAEIENATMLTGNMVVSLYLGEDGMPVSMTLTMPLAETEYVYTETEATAVENTVNTVEFNVNYTRLTTNAAVNHSVTLTADNIAMTANLVNEPNRLYLSIAGSENGEEMMFVYIDQNFTQTETALEGFTTIGLKAEDVDLRMAGPSSYVLNGVDFSGTDTMELFVNDMKMLTLTMTHKTSGAGASIINSGVVRPAELDDNEFANWFVNVFNVIQSWPFILIQSLPESVLDLMM